MRITNTLKNLLIEDSRFDVLYNKLVQPSDKAKQAGKSKGVLPFEILKEIVFADPTTRKPEGFDVETATVEDMKSDKVKIGKFSNWLIKHYVKPTVQSSPESPEYKSDVKEYRRLYLEDLFKMNDALSNYERIKVHLPEDQRDINKLTPEGLIDIMVNLPEDVKKRLTKNVIKSEKKELTKSNKYAHPGAQIIFEGPKYTLIKIEGGGEAQSEAASWYGGYYKYQEGESSWCTSPLNSNYFKTYIAQGPLYVVLANNDNGEVGQVTGLPQERYQFHFPSAQFMNRLDRAIDLVAFLNGEGEELKESLKPEFAKGLSFNDRVDITLGTGSAGRYVSLYGIESLFESLPDNIEHLLINNTGKPAIALDVPESLGRFKNLEALLLTNLVKTLPDSIGELTNLSFLTLSDNPSLEALPESMINLTELNFITLRNTNPNLIIPPKLSELLVEESNGFYYFEH
jgi:hypothetical protein